MAKTRKILGRASESAKIEGKVVGNRAKIKKNGSGIGPRTEAENHSKMEPTIMKMEPQFSKKWYRKIDVFLPRF